MLHIFDAISNGPSLPVHEVDERKAAILASLSIVRDVYSRDGAKGAEEFLQHSQNMHQRHLMSDSMNDCRKNSGMLLPDSFITERCPALQPAERPDRIVRTGQYPEILFASVF